MSITASICILAISFFGTLGVEYVCRRLHVFDMPGARKMNTTPVPRMGGVIFFLIPALVSLIYKINLAAPFVVGAIVVYLGGVFDDFKPLNSARTKLFFQVPAALIFSIGLELPEMPGQTSWTIPIRILVFFYLLFMTNAANLMDNMNGLTASLSLIWLAGLAFLAAQVSLLNYNLFMLLAILSIGGFLLRNFPWGKIYMGDQGSQLLGFLCAGLSMIVIPAASSGDFATRIQSTLIAAFLFSLVFILDVSLVVFIRIKEGRPVWQGDQCHLSHQLVRRGLTPSQAALVLATAQIAMVAMGCWVISF